MADASDNENAERQPGAQEDSGNGQLMQLQQQADDPVFDPQRSITGGAAGAAAPSAAGNGSELSKKLTREEAELIAAADGVLTLYGKEHTVDDNCNGKIDGIFAHGNNIYYAPAARQLEGEGCPVDTQRILSRMEMQEIKEAAERTKTSLPRFVAVLHIHPDTVQKYIGAANAHDEGTIGDLVELIDLVTSAGGVTAEDLGSSGTGKEFETRVAQLHRRHRFRQEHLPSGQGRRTPQGQEDAQWQIYAPFEGNAGVPAPAVAGPNAPSLGVFAEAFQNASSYSQLTTLEAKTTEEAIDNEGRCKFNPATMNLVMGSGSDVHKFKHMVVLPLQDTLKDYAPLITIGIVVKMIKGQLNSGDYYILGNTTKDKADFRAMSNVLTVFARAESSAGFNFWPDIRNMGDTICTTVAQYEGDDLVSANWTPLFVHFIKECKKREMERVACALTGRPRCTDYSTLKNEAGFKLELGSQLTAARTIQIWNAEGKRAAPSNVQPAKSPNLCHAFAASGTCSYGAGCRFAHVVPPPQVANPLPGGNKDVCRDFIAGRCARGAACRFSH